METTDNILDTVLPFIQSIEPMYWAIAGGVLFLLILIPIILRSIKKSKAAKIKPALVLHSFQISPLGKDAWLRLRNVGQLAVLKDLKFKKRNDIISKTNFREVRVGQGNTTSLFLQGTGQNRIREDFEIEFLYSDAQGHLYKQVLKLDGKVMQKAKLL
jgi:hypothetical protein